jgi:hypothetical protein
LPPLPRRGGARAVRPRSNLSIVQSADNVLLAQTHNTSRYSQT